MTIEGRASEHEIDEATLLREGMVDRLVTAAGLSQPIAKALRRIPRHVFVPGVPLERVYSGQAIVTRYNESGQALSSSSEPAVMAAMVEGLALARGHRVLEIGAGTGYNAALLAELVGEEGRVTTVDIDPAIVEEARAHLGRAGYEHVSLGCGDGWTGWLENAPYDRIVVTASVADLSPAWNAQLIEGGLLCVPFVFRPNAFTIPVLRKAGDAFHSIAIIQGGFMPLRGVGAPPDGTRRIGDWRVTSARAIDEARLAALLAERPAVELSGDWNWKAMALLAFVEPNAITLARADRQTVSMGIFDEDGLAVVEWAGGNLAGMRTLLVGVGAPSVVTRLRERLAVFAARSWNDVSLVAVPSGTMRPPGDAVFERANYTVGVSVAS